MHGDAADPEVEAMMPVVDVALGHKGKRRTEGRTSSTDPGGREPDQRPQRPRGLDVGSPADACGVVRLHDDSQWCGPVCMLASGGYARRTTRHVTVSRSEARTGV